jgi:hypothetical protein
MNDVTAPLRTYRECVRHLWNTHFLELLPVAQDPWGLRDQFDDICSALFGALVVERLGLASGASSDRILSPNCDPPAVLGWLRVVPSGDCGAPIMINRERASDSSYWDHPIRRVGSSDVDLRLVHWFDFDELSFRDFKYYLVRIVASPFEDLVGRAALLDCEYASVLLEPSAFSTAEPAI